MKRLALDDILSCDFRPVPNELAGWSADSSWLICNRGRTGATTAGVYLVSPGGQREAARLLCAGEFANAQLAGNHLVVVSPGAEGDALLEIEVSSGRRRTVFTHRRIPSGARVSQDRRWVAWTQPQGVAPARTSGTGARAPRPSVTVIDRSLPCSPWEQADELVLCELASGKLSTLVSGDHAIRDLVWVPGSATLLFTAVRYFGFTYAERLGRIESLDVTTGKRRTLVSGAGQHLKPAVSADGAWLAFNHEPRDEFFPRFCQLAILALPDGTAFSKVTESQYVLSAAKWSRDAERLFFEYQAGAFRQIAAIDRAGRALFTTASPSWKTNVCPAPDGRRVAFLESDMAGRVSVSVEDIDRPGAVCVMERTPDLRDFRLGDLREVCWANGPLTLSGLLLTPTRPDTGPPFPLVVDVHGAATLRQNQALVTKSVLEWHWWAERGYCVFAPDYRTSGSYGWQWIERARTECRYNRADAEDVLAGVAALVDAGTVARERLAIVGHSLGALVVTWLLTMSDQFKAAVLYEGPIEQYLNFGCGGYLGGNAVAERQYGGKPWEVEENYRANSPLFELTKIGTPTLLVLGRNETPTYPYEYLFTLLRCRGVETQLLVYENEGHLVTRPENQRDLLQRAFQWIDSRLRVAAETSATAGD